MRISKVKVENFLSIAEATIEFKDSGLMLIEGWNTDTDSANGAGKSAVFTAICWGLYGKHPRNVSPAELLRKGTKTCTVSVWGTLGKGSEFFISRSRPNKFTATVDDKSIEEDEIHSLLGVSIDQFMLVQYFAQNLSPRFLDLNDASRKDVLLKLINIDAFANAKVVSDGKLKSVETEISSLKSKQISISSKISAYSESVVPVKDLFQEINLMKVSIFEANVKIQELDAIEEPDVSKYLDVLGKLKTEHQDLLMIKGQYSSLKNEIRRIDEETDPEFASDFICPSCKEEVNDIGGKLIKHDRASHLEKIEQRKRQRGAKREALMLEVVDIEKKLAKESVIVDTIGKCKDKIQTIKAEFSEAQVRKRELVSFVSSRKDKLAFIEADRNKRDELVSKVKDLEAQQLEISSSIEDLQNRSQVLQSVSQVLSPTGVSAYVLDSVIDNFNDKVRQILEPIWPNASYKLLSFKENKNGSVVAKLSDSLAISGEGRSVGSLSGGERKCLSLAIDFALLAIVSDGVGSSISPVILDEPFDGLDAQNREKMVEILQELSTDRQIVVVDHSNESSGMFDSVIRITKKSGISSVS